MSKKKTSRAHRSSRARSQKLTRNGMGKILVPVVVVGVVGVAGYFGYQAYKRSRASGAAFVPSLQSGAASILPDAAAQVTEVAEQVTKAAAKLVGNDYVFAPKPGGLPNLGTYVDVSAAGAPYKGLLGLSGGPVNTVNPHDAIRRATNFAAVRRVDQPFNRRKVRTGGIFARDLYTGMNG